MPVNILTGINNAPILPIKEHAGFNPKFTRISVTDVEKHINADLL
jgi:hypothetical protein